jgi:hypothetical protein
VAFVASVCRHESEPVPSKKLIAAVLRFKKRWTVVEEAQATGYPVLT